MKTNFMRLAATGLLLITGISAAQTRTVGLLAWNQARSFNGYTLLYGKHVGRTVLINNNGYICHSWNSTYEPGQAAYLLPNGNLLRCSLLKTALSIGGGEGGRFEMRDWNGTMVWAFNYSGATYSSHHDVKMLPNGNLLAMAVEKKTKAECVQAGFDSTLLQDGYVAAEYLVEFHQTGDTTYQIVWQWHLWDHLVQGRDPTKSNYGTVKDHPELNDVASTTGSQVPAFWNHGNSIDYNAKYDQICINIRNNSEFWILDHSTTTAQAASHTGGTYGKGGDILFRWGNPAAYDRGTTATRILYQEHDAQWIPSDCPGAGHILIFNNGIDRPSPQYSTIEEMVLPCDTATGIFPGPGATAAWGPSATFWTWNAPVPTSLYSAEVSGVQRLPNGNTLICEGLKGQITELTPDSQIVWRYINPWIDLDTLSQGEDPTADVDPRGDQNNALFKVHRYAPDYPGLAGRDLAPTKPIEKNPWPDLSRILPDNRTGKEAALPEILINGPLVKLALPEGSGALRITIHSLSGAMVYHKETTAKQIVWNAAEIRKGMYVMSISTGLRTFTRKIILH